MRDLLAGGLTRFFEFSEMCQQDFPFPENLP